MLVVQKPNYRRFARGILVQEIGKNAFKWSKREKHESDTHVSVEIG